MCFCVFEIVNKAEEVFIKENFVKNSSSTPTPRISDNPPFAGQTIYTISSPYGLLSSELYKNTINKGIISNVFKINS